MIEDPPLMSIRKNFTRPTTDQVNDFQGVPCGFVVDAMQGRGALDYQIKPISNDHAVFAGVFKSNAPRLHPLAYYGHRRCDWLGEGEQILALHDQVTAIDGMASVFPACARRPGQARCHTSSYTV